MERQGVMKIGTCIRGQHLLEDLENAVATGFDTVELYFNETLAGTDFKEISSSIKRITGYYGVTVSGVGLYCNPLQSEEARKELEYCIENVHLLGTDFVGTFAGAIPGKSVEDAIPEFKYVFTSLTELAEYNGVRIGIENAHMYGNWYNATCNIGFCPRAWEMMFSEVQSGCLGLEWEPSHQAEQLIDPLKQLGEWMPKIFHVHGKDAHVDYRHIKKYGAWFGESYCVHRFPGMGDTDWEKIINILEHGGYEGDITVEGYHDPVYCGDKEADGQRMALVYLRECCGY